MGPSTIAGVVTMRTYGGPADLRAMQGLTQRIWSPASPCHIGDLAWQRYQHAGREGEWATALWEADGEVVAWGWAELPGRSLSLLVDPAHPALIDAVLTWFADVADVADVTEVDEQAARRLTVTVVEEETHLIAALERRGYVRQDDPHFHRYLSRRLVDLPRPVVPDGYRVRAITGEAELAERVAVHRAVWHPSRVTEESYRDVMAAWPYRAELDWVVQASDGRFVANCLIWLDEANGVAELEPVGTHPEFRRLGLGRAVCLAAMHAAHDSGADTAVVYPVEGHPRFPEALPLYTNLGFTPDTRTHTYDWQPAAAV